jgi:2-iminobutanoate/2-iminopropanoate deaminase
MEKQIISTVNAPAAIGPYSQAVKVGNLLFTSGQIPLDPQTGELVNDSVENATERVMQNLKAILEEAGTSFEKL